MRSEDERWERRWQRDVRLLLVLLIVTIAVATAIVSWLLLGVDQHVDTLDQRVENIEFEISG